MNISDNIPGAIHVGEWHRDDCHPSGRARSFTGSKRANAAEPDGKRVRVALDGAQFGDGSIERCMVINGDIHFLDRAEAWAFVNDAAAALHEWEALT